MKHAAIPAAVVHIPMRITIHDLPRSPKGVLPSAMIWSETMTRKRPYVLSGVYGSSPVWILKRRVPKVIIKIPKMKRITTSKERSPKNSFLIPASPLVSVFVTITADSRVFCLLKHYLSLF